MRRVLHTLGIALLTTLIVSGSGCILEEKVIDIVLSDEISAEFIENHQTEAWTNNEIVDYASEINQILEDNGYSRSDIGEAKVVSAHYGVTAFAGAHDWTINGMVEVRRIDGGIGPWTTVVNYTSVSVAGALGAKIPAALNAGGVTLLNQALADFIAGTDPILEFRVNNDGDVIPDPSAVDPIIFDWRAWLLIQVVIKETLDVPDPF